MFDNIGWGEILVLIIIAVIVIGPERLPDLIKDVRAAAYAARKAINNARAELDGGFGEEFDELREPISKAAEWGRLGPRKAVTKGLFDDDDAVLDDFDPKKIMQDDPRDTPDARQRSPQPQPSQQQARQNQNQNPENKGDYGTGGGFSWADVT